MTNKICAVTEASDKFFHLTRSSVYSFIEHNRWFDGTLKLIVHRDLPLSQHNFLILKLIYPNIEIISINAQTTNKIKHIASFLNSNKYFDILFNTLKIFAFTLTSTNFVYFSNKCLFLNNIADILIPGKITCDSNFSIVYVDRKTVNIQLDSNNIPQFEDFISTLEHTICHNLSLYSSVTPDIKFTHSLQSKLKSVPCIVFNTFSSESASKYSKIHRVWLHKNHEILNNLQKPSTYSPAILEKKPNIGRNNVLQNYEATITSPSLKFLIVCSGLNCGNNVKKCFNSISNQTYKNFKAILISDGSTDNTANELLKIKNIDPRISIEIYEDNKAAAYRRYFAINNSGVDEETVIVLVGLDDHIFPEALATIKKQYDAGKWMTYGNWINQYGKMLPNGFLQFDEETHTSRNYRKVRYRSTALNTFKKFLFDNIPVDDFKMDGNWIDSTTESELMFSCLEMCGKDRIGIIEKAIYLYNANLPGGTLRRLGSDYKYKIYDRIVLRPKKDLLIRP